ncbi:hypothetical protein PYW07_014365 [Mythimna separata]|uniref:Uncharacterized protein n=1 Tax=Mythimna separata TaxID=271217 RepID=A0AAD7Z0W0_MYTSE|nr:hypothetical protein PYW07_014365 [Mythimna separata]
MGWSQAIVLVAYFGILQCDLSQSTKCNCNNKPTIIQFRIPQLDSQLAYPFYSNLPYPYVNAHPKPSDSPKKCSTPKCNTKLQPAAVKISIPTATKSGWANIIIDTRRHPNATTEDCKPKPHKTSVNVYVTVGNSNKTISHNSTEPAVTAKTNVSSTKDDKGNHVTSVSSADNAKSSVNVKVELDETGKDDLGDDEYLVKSDSTAKDDEGNVAKSTSTTGDKDKNKAKPKPKVNPKPVKKDPAAKDTATHDPKKPAAKEPEAKKPEAEKPEGKKPVAEEPEAKKPEAEKPEAKKPESEEPKAEEPVAKEAEGEKPEAKEAEGEKPAVESPDVKEHEAEDPKAEKPAAEVPAAEDLADDGPEFETA